jgi:hypothetical protein
VRLKGHIVAKKPYFKLDLFGYDLGNLHARPGGMAGNIHVTDLVVEIVRQRGPLGFVALTAALNEILRTYPAECVASAVRHTQHAIDDSLPIHISEKDGMAIVAYDK